MGFVIKNEFKMSSYPIQKGIFPNNEAHKQIATWPRRFLFSSPNEQALYDNDLTSNGFTTQSNGEH